MAPPSPAHDKRWESFLVSSLLEALREGAQSRYPGDIAEYKGSKKAFRRAEQLRKIIVSKKSTSAKSTLASANTFIKDVAGGLGVFLTGLKLVGRFRDGSSTSKKVRAVLLRNGRVESSLRYAEGQLRLLLPDVAGVDENRWPGHVSYRAGVNHFVAVCLRVHSILPDVPFDVVTQAAARRIIVPALAHNLKFFSKSHPQVYRFFVHSDTIALRRGKPLAPEEIPDDIPGESRYVVRKWTRLFNVCMSMGDVWGERRVGELYVEVQGLLRDYEADPRSSRLWRDLSILAAGDMAVDEMLVSWVIEDVGGDPKAQASSPLINCARSRFGLLRYAYLMAKEAEEFREDFNKGQRAAAALVQQLEESVQGKLPETLVNQAFGWAYLLSRNNLLGRKSKAHASTCREPAAAALLLYDLLNELRLKAASENHRTLALRYLVGFMTNPRFIKPLSKIRPDPKSTKGPYYSVTVEGLISDASKMPMMPPSIILMAKARVALHHAYLHRDDAGRQVQELQSCLDHYAGILKQLDKPAAAGIMDGEVIAWALPEMYYAIDLLKRHDSGSVDDWQDVQDALQVLGEMQYGVFFSPKEEMARVEEGLQIAIGP
jgi:hypothetical protein